MSKFIEELIESKKQRADEVQYKATNLYNDVEEMKHYNAKDWIAFARRHNGETSAKAYLIAEYLSGKEVLSLRAAESYVEGENYLEARRLYKSLAKGCEEDLIDAQLKANLCSIFLGKKTNYAHLPPHLCSILDHVGNSWRLKNYDLFRSDFQWFESHQLLDNVTNHILLTMKESLGRTA